MPGTKADLSAAPRLSLVHRLRARETGGDGHRRHVPRVRPPAAALAGFDAHNNDMAHLLHNTDVAYRYHAYAQCLTNVRQILALLLPHNERIALERNASICIAGRGCQSNRLAFALLGGVQLFCKLLMVSEGGKRHGLAGMYVWYERRQLPAMATSTLRLSCATASSLASGATADHARTEPTVTPSPSATSLTSCLAGALREVALAIPDIVVTLANDDDFIRRLFDLLWDDELFAFIVCFTQEVLLARTRPLDLTEIRRFGELALSLSPSQLVLFAQVIGTAAYSHQLNDSDQLKAPNAVLPPDPLPFIGIPIDPCAPDAVFQAREQLALARAVERNHALILSIPQLLSRLVRLIYCDFRDGDEDGASTATSSASSSLPSLPAAPDTDGDANPEDGDAPSGPRNDRGSAPAAANVAPLRVPDDAHGYAAHLCALIRRIPGLFRRRQPQRPLLQTPANVPAVAAAAAPGAQAASRDAARRPNRQPHRSHEPASASAGGRHVAWPEEPINVHEDLRAAFPTSRRLIVHTLPTMPVGMYRMEVAGALWALLYGKRRMEVQCRLAGMGFLDILSVAFDRIMALDHTELDPDQDLPEPERSPMCSLKLQLLRLVHIFCEDLHHCYDGIAIVDRASAARVTRGVSMLNEKDGILSKVIRLYLEQPAHSPLMYGGPHSA